MPADFGPEVPEDGISGLLVVSPSRCWSSGERSSVARAVWSVLSLERGYS